MADPYDRHRGRHRQRLAPVGHDVPVRLLAAQHVPLSTDQEQAAGRALAGPLADLAARDTASPALEADPEGKVCCPSGHSDGPENSKGAA